MDTKPRTEMTLSDAIESLDYFDLVAIKKEWGVSLGQAEENGEALAYAVVWILERRENPQITLKDVKLMKMVEINHYFTKEEDVDPLDQTTTS